MKTFAKLFAVLAFLAVGFTACSDDEDAKPAITVYINGTSQLSITISEDEIADLEVKVDYDAEAKISEITFDEVNGSNLEGFPKTKGFKSNTLDQITLNSNDLGIATVGTYSFTTKLTDKNNDNANRTISITVKAKEDPGTPETNLSTAADFTLGRPEQTGFPSSAMGITWSSNASDGNTANFTATAVSLTETEYNAINTVEKLESAYTDGSKVSTFSAKSDANFTAKFLIVKDGETLRLVKMNNLTFAEGANKAYFNERH